MSALLSVSAPFQLGANPITTVLMLGLLSLLPFLLMMTTSFLKFSVVLSILRTALGTQQVPPTPVIMGLSVVLSMYVMAPVGQEVYEVLRQEMAASQRVETLSGGGARTIVEALGKAKPPLQRFLARHAHQDDVAVFFGQARRFAAERAGDPAAADEVAEDGLMVLLPAFAISELAEAFAIGFLIFLPFLIIDMVVSNILLAMGMHMLPPVVVSMPFKLLLFIMVDGWQLLSKGLLQPYMVV
ncbi:MAG: type III secretion system export apparatus subunit SctR [Acidobacteriota bacterium]